MNDCVVNEMKPNDIKHSWLTYGMKGQSVEGNCMNINKLYSEKIWDELVSYSQAEYPIKDFNSLPYSIRPNKKEVQINEFDANTNYSSNWERPTLLMIYYIVKFHRKLK